MSKSKQVHFETKKDYRTEAEEIDEETADLVRKLEKWMEDKTSSDSRMVRNYLSQLNSRFSHKRIHDYEKRLNSITREFGEDFDPEDFFSSK